MAEPRQLCLGIITGARGVRGEVRIKTFTERPEDITGYGALTDEAGQQLFALSDPKPIKGGIAARIEGILDRTAAEALKGTHLYVGRDALPDLEEEEFYHADLVGLRVQSVDGEDIGIVAAVYDFGAGDILEIERNKGPVLIVPFTRDAVPEIDTERNFLILVPPSEIVANGDGDSEAD